MALIEPRTVRVAGGSCVIRAVEEAEAPAMLALMNHMSRTTPFQVREPDEGMQTAEEVAAFTKAHRAHPGQLYIVAVSPEGPGAMEGRIGGLRFACGDRRKVSHHGHFGIWVHEDWRGRGVGSALIRVLLEWAAAHSNIEKVCLGVLEPNVKARALYERLGFRQEGRSPRHFKFGPGEYVDDIQMAIYVKPGVAPEGFVTWDGGRG